MKNKYYKSKTTIKNPIELKKLHSLA